jgi:uncharacterized RmlC-like cupin family protein
MTQVKPHNDIRIATGKLGEPVMGPQRQQLTVAVHSGLAPIRSLSSGFVRMPGGHHALPHIHADSEIQVYVVRGRIASLVGPDMTPTLHGPGSLIYIAPGVEHVGVNLDPYEPAELVDSVPIRSSTRTWSPFPASMRSSKPASPSCAAITCSAAATSSSPSRPCTP